MKDEKEEMPKMQVAQSPSIEDQVPKGNSNPIDMESMESMEQRKQIRKEIPQVIKLSYRKRELGETRAVPDETQLSKYTIPGEYMHFWLHFKK